MIKKIVYIYKILLPYLWNTKQAKLATLSTIVLIGVDIMATTYFPYLWKNLINAPIQSKPITWFVENTILLFVVWFLVKNILHLREIVFFPVTNQAIRKIRLQTILRAHRVSLKNLETYTVQEIISGTSRISQSVRGFMRVSFISIFPSLAKIFTLSEALFAAHRVCGGIIGGAYAGLIAAACCLKYYINAKSKAWHLTDHVNTAIGQNLYNTAIIRFSPQENNLQLNHLFDLEAHAWNKYNIASYVLHLVQDGAFYLGAGVVFCLLIRDYSRGIIGLDKIVLIYGLIASMHSPLVEVVRNFTRFFGGLIDLNKTLDILHLPEENKPLQLVDFTPQPIHLQHVSFSYTGAKKLLKNINLIIHPGDKIGIAGPSGTGKSTLCQIMAGLLKPHIGEGLYGSLPIEQIDSTSLGKVLSYIPQIHLAQDLSVEEHTYGVALKKQAFSGGEYQKHILQKALQNHPQILILDETLNALDESSAEEVLTDVLRSVPTVIIVSHSPSLISKMKRVFELKDGYLTEMQATNL